MTEERRRALEQLLSEAMSSLVIRPSSQNSYTHLTINVNPPVNAYLPVNVNLPVGVYRKHLKQHCASYTEDPWNWILQDFRPEIQNEPTKSKLLDFLRKELAESIREDEIGSGSYAIEYNSSDECTLHNMRYTLLHLRFLLEHLLTISIAEGIEGAVLAFDRHIDGTVSSFQAVMALEGIQINTEIPVFEGVRLVPRPQPTTHDLPTYLPYLRNHRSNLMAEPKVGPTLLIIDRPVFSILHNPSATPFREGLQKDGVPFSVDAKLKRFPNSDAVRCFTSSFCQALSIACDSPVQVARSWGFMAKDKFLYPGASGSVSQSLGPFGRSTEAKESQIQDAKDFLDILANPNLDLGDKLDIPIDRWIRSKASWHPVEKMIDLVIALESLYLSDITPRTELSFRLGLHAAWHLGKYKQERENVQEEFRRIYEWRSSIVHTGQLPKKYRTPSASGEVAKSIEKVQKCCRKSIVKILEAKKVPSWADLVLGD